MAVSQVAGEPVPLWPGTLVDVPRGRLHVRQAQALPEAESAVFIHGLGGSSTNWTDIMDLLSRQDDELPTAPVLTCSAVDLPGFGHSPPAADRDYRVAAHAEAVIELIDKQGQWPVHLIGNSMGGAVAIRVAARRPDLVRTLMLISPALPDLRPRLLPLRLAFAVAPGVGPALMDWLRRIPAQVRTDRSFKDLFNDPALVHPVRRSEEIAEMLRRDGLEYANDALMLSARSLIGEYFRPGPQSLWRDAARVSAPALILHGSHDKLVNPVMAAKAARAFRTARVIVLSGVGHVAMIERPAIVVAEIRAFLEWVKLTRHKPDPASLTAAS